MYNLDLILGHVSRNDLRACSLVNKAFYKASLPFLWCSLTFDVTIPDDAIDWCIEAMESSTTYRPGLHVRSLTMKDYPMDGHQLVSLINFLEHLEYFRLEVAEQINDSCFSHIAHLCPELTTLILSRVGITPMTIQAIGHEAHRLDTLELYNCHHVTSDVLGLLGTCPLKKMVYSPPFHTCDKRHQEEETRKKKNPPALSSDIAWELAYHQHQLTILQIHDDREQDYTPLLTTRGGRAWPHLTRFEIHNCARLTDDAAIQFIQAHPQLDYLALCNSKKITNKTLDAIATYLPNLKQLNVNDNRRLTADGIQQLFQKANSGLKQGGIYFRGCGIDQKDFKCRLDPRGLDYDAHDEVVWISADALMDEQDDVYNNDLY